MHFPKKYLIVAVLAAVLLSFGSVFAGALPAKSEMSVSGSYFDPKGEGETVWVADGQIAMPIGEEGFVVFGPKLHLSSAEDDAMGAVLEVNFLGTNHSGPFFGADGLYLQKEIPGLERYSVNGLAGLKIQVGPGGFIKVYASAPIAGAGKDLTHITGNVGIGIRF